MCPSRAVAEADVRIAVVLPAYREEARIAEVIRGCLAHLPIVMVVDDCSPDATSARALEAGAGRGPQDRVCGLEGVRLHPCDCLGCGWSA
ncbi:MAG: glycosyltransferase [Verrucomicrobia bacterium]|nr:glycosyltransferase [Verrucomicrobiota bacterium]